MAASLKKVFYLQKWTAACLPTRSLFGIGKKKTDKAADHKFSEPNDGEATVVSEYNETPPAPPAKFYQATDDVAVQILDIAQRLCNSSVEPATTLTSNHLKYQILSECEKQFDFGVDNIDLSDLTNLSDVIKYYSTSHGVSTAEEELQNSDLPPNLHIQLEPVRFTETTKHMFDNKTAFPGRDTIVTSLKYKHIYEGYKNPKKYTEKDGFKYY